MTPTLQLSVTASEALRDPPSAPLPAPYPCLLGFSSSTLAGLPAPLKSTTCIPALGTWLALDFRLSEPSISDPDGVGVGSVVIPIPDTQDGPRSCPYC